MGLIGSFRLMSNQTKVVLFFKSTDSAIHEIVIVIVWCNLVAFDLDQVFTKLVLLLSL